MAYNWAKIRNDWSMGMKNVEIQNKWGISKGALATHIKKWKEEESNKKESAAGNNKKIETDAISTVWNTLLEKDNKYANYTDSQKYFVLYCAFGLTPLEAYKKAGYSLNQKHLSVRASELKRKHMDAIIEAKKLVKIPYDIEQDDILKFMGDVLNADITDFLDYTVEDRQKLTRFGIIEYKANVIKMKSKEEINSKLIKIIRISKDGNFELELYSKEMAVDFFTRYFNMYNKDGKETLVESNMSKMLEVINQNGSNINIDLDEDPDNDLVNDDEEV